MIDEETVKATLHAARSRGAPFAEIFVERSATQTITLQDQKIESVSSGDELGAGIRVVSEGVTGYAYTNTIDAESLAEAARAAAAALESGRPVGSTINLKRALVETSHPIEEDAFSVSSDKKAAFLWEADDAARSEGPQIIQVTVSLGFARQKVLIANTDEVLVDDERTRSRFVVIVVAGRENDRQTHAESPGGSVGMELLSQYPPAVLARQAAEKAILKLDSEPCPAGEFPVVLGARAGGVLFHEACGHPCEGDNAVKGATVFAALMGKQVAEEFVTIVDDATYPNGWGSFAFDDEGTSARRTVIVDRGVLMSYLLDKTNANKLDSRSTGNGRRQSYEHPPIPRMSNTYLEKGSSSPEEIIASVDRGVWMGRLAGGQVNPITGQFVFGGSEAFLIEKGELTKPLRGANLIGDGPSILNRIEAVGSDFELVPGVCGKFGQFAPAGTGQPTLKVSRMTVGGTG